jgi:hypothetical protein
MRERKGAEVTTTPSHDLTHSCSVLWPRFIDFTYSERADELPHFVVMPMP